MRIEAASRPLRGQIRVPGDKSISHRALLINALGVGSARLVGSLDAADLAASRRLVQAVGCTLRPEGDAWILQAPDRLREPADVIDCGNSGTTMRLGAGLLAHVDGVGVLTGDASLRARPMKRVLEPLRAMGARVDGRDGGSRAPLVVRGAGLVQVSVALPVASAQVKSALLLAGRDCGVRVREPRRSRDHTERMLAAMGAAIAHEADGSVSLGPGPWACVDVVVPGDLSSAAFWLVAGALVPGSQIELPGVGLNPTRVGVLRVLEAMGAKLTIDADAPALEPAGRLRIEASELVGTRIDGELALQCLDELPVLAVAAACARGETVIGDAAELRVKESDRIARVVAGLRALGAEVEERPDGMVIAGGGLTGAPGAVIDAEGDHRLAMAFTVAALVSPGGAQVRNADVVRTSYPGFFDDLAGLAS